MLSQWEDHTRKVQSAIRRMDDQKQRVDYAERNLTREETDLAERVTEFREARDAFLKDFPELVVK